MPSQQQAKVKSKEGGKNDWFFQKVLFWIIFGSIIKNTKHPPTFTKSSPTLLLFGLWPPTPMRSQRPHVLFFRPPRSAARLARPPPATSHLCAPGSPAAGHSGLRSTCLSPRKLGMWWEDPALAVGGWVGRSGTHGPAPRLAGCSEKPQRESGTDTPGGGGRVRATAARAPPNQTQTRCSGRGIFSGLGQTWMEAGGRCHQSRVLCSERGAPQALRVNTRPGLQAGGGASRGEAGGREAPEQQEAAGPRFSRLRAARAAQPPPPGVARDRGPGTHRHSTSWSCWRRGDGTRCQTRFSNSSS